MKRYDGTARSPIWLIGDSNPKNWENKLKYPFDSRHPIRHNIWTSILENIQNDVYLKIKKRINTSQIFIRNAIENSDLKKEIKGKEWTNKEAKKELLSMKILVGKYKPKIVLSFGSFSYEFMRRVLDNKHKRQFTKWDTISLGDKFRESINNFESEETNLIPLLHRSIAGGHFLKSHTYFVTGTKNNKKACNYFEYTGNKLAELIINNKNKLDIWL